jgi:hypothetical protein
VRNHFSTHDPRGDDVLRWWLPEVAALRPGEPKPQLELAAIVTGDARLEADEASLEALTYPIEAADPCAGCGGAVLIASAEVLRELGRSVAEAAETGGEPIAIFCDSCLTPSADGADGCAAVVSDREAAW